MRTFLEGLPNNFTEEQILRMIAEFQAGMTPGEAGSARFSRATAIIDKEMSRPIDEASRVEKRCPAK